ncbi:histone-fold-containing protein [Basidiobolus meristosporus CBS 931.73]|uniref:Histone-fold-containing protein n=1 Tax=Basidiobolus meristosporus CBS 931.73 TaxID=1314790 RepID=A0A1Y1Y129_9FUNG|nr:histone-fold-containing protein [Basidiobolus meristosporus CBS 931.73]|eukprot:ORX91722.1 histone-fold-containing protein [Basidiobolus meristosporus CBS 931.73]
MSLPASSSSQLPYQSMTPVANTGLEHVATGYPQVQSQNQPPAVHVAASHAQAQGQAANQQLSQQDQFLQNFWASQVSIAETYESDFKLHPLPLARIKKVMKTDEDVKMISAEAPILFSKACEIFITEITMRAWMHAEENKRRTLQRSDVASAVSKSDQFDFLIDIVPREDLSKAKRPKEESEIYDPNAYAAYYQAAGLSQYQGGLAVDQRVIDPAYYQQFTQEQLQQYQLQLQQQMQQSQQYQMRAPTGTAYTTPGQGQPQQSSQE